MKVHLILLVCGLTLSGSSLRLRRQSKSSSDGLSVSTIPECNSGNGPLSPAEDGSKAPARVRHFRLGLLLENPAMTADH